MKRMRKKKRNPAVHIFVRFLLKLTASADLLETDMTDSIRKNAAQNRNYLARIIELAKTDNTAAGEPADRNARDHLVSGSPSSTSLPADLAIQNKSYSTGTVQPYLSGSLPHWIPVSVSYSFCVSSPILKSLIVTTSSL